MTAAAKRILMMGQAIMEWGGEVKLDYRFKSLTEVTIESSRLFLDYLPR
jgi:hypothetical protein